MSAHANDLTPLQAQKAMRLNVIASGLGTTALTLMTGTFLTGYALLLKAGPVTIGLMGAFPLITLPAALLSAYVAERYGRRKRLWLVASWAMYASIVLYLLAPALFPASYTDARLGLLLVAVFLNSICAAASAPVWMAWMADIVPSRIEGAFWGRRNTIVNLSLLVASVGASLFIDAVGRERLGGFLALFGAAIAFGAVATLLHYRIPEPLLARQERPPTFLRTFAAPFRNPAFVRYAIFAAAFNFACWIMVPFIVVFFLKELELSYTTIAIVSALNIAGSVISSRFWGYLVDRFGPKPVLSLCAYLKPLAAVAFVLATRANYIYVLTALLLVDGFVSGGMGVASLPMTIGLGPREQRSAHLAMLNSIVGVVAAVAPVLGGLFLKATASFQGWVGLEITNYRLLFLVSAVLRVAVLPLLLIVRDTRGGPTGAFLRRFVAGNPMRVVRYCQLLAGSPDETTRVKATQALGETRSAIATDELVKALDDPSLEVREEAAAALGKIADTRAIEPLVQKLQSPESGIQALSAKALGKIPHTRSVEALIEALPADDAALKKDVVRALGDMRDPRASDHLLRLLEAEHDPAVVETVAEALAKLGEIQAIHYILPQLRQTTNFVVKRQFAIALGNLLGTEGEFYTVLTKEIAVEGQEIERMAARCRRELKSRYPRLVKLNTPDAVLERVRLVEISARIGRALDYYHARQWGRTVEQLETASMLLLDVTTPEQTRAEAFDTEAARRRLVEKIKALAERSPRLSADYWYIHVLTSALYGPDNPVRGVEAMLAVYAFQYAFFEQLTQGPPPGTGFNASRRSQRGPRWVDE